MRSISESVMTAHKILDFVGMVAFLSPAFYVGVPLLLLPFYFTWIFDYVLDMSMVVFVSSVLIMSVHSLYLAFLLLKKKRYYFLIRFIFFHVFYNIFAIYMVYFRIRVNGDDLDMEVFRLPL